MPAETRSSAPACRTDGATAPPRRWGSSRVGKKADMPRKFEILERAPEAQFKCVATGLKGHVVDMDKFVPDYGRVYLHVSVIAAMAEKLGFLRDDVATQLRDELAAARAEAAAWPAALALFEEDVH